MLEERDPLAVGRDSRVREVPSRLRENFADGILQAILSVDVPDDGQLVSIRGPVCLAHPGKHFAGRSALERHPTECAGEKRVPDVADPRQDRQLAA